MTETQSLYASNVTMVAPVESWSEVRCPACVPLGWPAPRLLFRVTGVSIPGGVLETKCHRCGSLVAWDIGRPVLRVVEYGQKNNKKQVAVFE